MDGNRLRDEIVARLRGEIEALGLAAGVPGDGAGRRRQAAPDLRAHEAEEGGRGRACCRRASSCPTTATQAEVEDVVGELAADPSVHGILVPAAAARATSTPSRCWR